MLLTVDIGNTTVALAVMRGKKVVFSASIENGSLRSSLNQELGRVQRRFPHLSKAILCSVVPRNSQVVSAAVQRCLKIKPRMIGKDVWVPIKNNYRNPKQVGQDRLVGAYAAKELYGSPAIIIDLGTAITFDVISQKGEYEGGMIIPGIRLSAESLYQKTALLPKIEKFEIPKTLVGRNTKDSILSGIFYGYGAMCRGLIVQLAREIDGHPRVIVTGGHTRLMRRFLRDKNVVIDDHLVFKGMQLIAASELKR